MTCYTAASLRQTISILDLKTYSIDKSVFIGWKVHFEVNIWILFTQKWVPSCKKFQNPYNKSTVEQMECSNFVSL